MEMDLVSRCKDKLQGFRVKELKDILTRLGLSKQGKKQDLVDKILAILADDQASKIWAKKHAVRADEVARLVDDTHRKMQMAGATDLASSSQNSTPAKSVEDFDDSPLMEMKIRCLCGSSLPTESMIQCEDPKCQVWQHMSCVIIPENPTEGIPPVPPQFYCELCRLSRSDPFCLTVAHPLNPVNLIVTSMPTDGTNPVQGIEKTFQITRSEMSWLSKSEYDMQVWCMLLNDKVLFRMQWPQYADLQVNGVAVRAINRPGSQLLGVNGRDEGPTITQYTIDGINKISVTGCDSRLFCVGIRLLKRRSLQQILNIIPKEPDGEPFEDALARVRRCVSGGNDAENADSDSDLEIVAESFTINLRCPMSGSRIKVAGRFRPCAHMGCFDLDTFVGMQQRSRKWQCPICLKNYSLEHITVDPYFNRVTTMMQSCEEDTTDIEVKPDGSWRVKSETESFDLRQWHLPDGTVIKSYPETSNPVKHESISLKLGIKKNSNGLWQVNKHPSMNTLSSSSTNPPNTVSGREGEDLSVNQNGADVIVLSDSDEENDDINQLIDGGLDLFSAAEDEFGWQLPIGNQTGPNFELFGSDDAGVNSSAAHFNSNGGLVDNRMAFGGDDPPLQIFLPTKPSEFSGHGGFQNHPEASNVQNEDWISLRLGGNNGDSAPVAQNGLNPDDVSIQSLTETAAAAAAAPFVCEGSRERSDSPFSIPHERPSVRPRLYL